MNAAKQQPESSVDAPVDATHPVSGGEAPAWAIRSMTGFGVARGRIPAGPRQPEAEVEVTIRSVNHRYIKTSVKLPDTLARYERDLDACLKEELHRGSIQLNVKLRRSPSVSPAKVDRERAKALAEALSKLADETGLARPTIDGIALLPGAILDEDATPAGQADAPSSAGSAADDAADAARLQALLGHLRVACQQLNRMRDDEGHATAADVDGRCSQLLALVDQAEVRSPISVQQNRDRLHARLQDLLGEATPPLDHDAIAREVALFADRVDIAEEISRLRHHVQQMRTTLQTPGEVGRRLDFIAQEMLRETNTIGSKANDAEIATVVVDLKTEIERIKEQVQNIE